MTLAADELHEYVHAAWCFAVSILWPSEDFNDDETIKALSDLQSYFSMAPNMAEAFKTFCMRVVLAKVISQMCPILHPGFWLNPVNIEGLTHGKRTNNRMQRFLHKEPLFEKAMEILSKYYVDYIKSPLANTILRCREDLANLGEDKWMGVFFEGIQRQPSV